MIGDPSKLTAVSSITDLWLYDIILFSAHIRMSHFLDRRVQPRYIIENGHLTLNMPCIPVNFLKLLPIHR